jgi:hypothetical protein
MLPGCKVALISKTCFAVSCICLGFWFLSYIAPSPLLSKWAKSMPPLRSGCFQAPEV